MSDLEPKAVRLEICPSSYFRAMLGPHYAEGGKLCHTTATTTTTATLEGTEDSLLEVTAEDEFDPIALATVLYVLHSRPENIPRSITSENLLNIAIICNYYDCAEAMRP
ncbi:hypothetical protein BDD12DRAFT_886386 [Trichophaea hybrida]|nr:hypothetical protein BDD12DRAFT_886386 [Trichophaea hybrida]